MKQKIAAIASVLLIAAVLAGSTAAVTAGEQSEYCFSVSDFTANETEPQGVFIASVPASTIGSLQLGSRVLRTGDVIPSSRLSDVRLYPVQSPTGDAVIVYREITGGHLAQETELKIPLLTQKNSAPTAKDCKLETYRNMENTGAFDAEDPDGDALTFTLTSNPKRGEVTINEAGTFLYTPIKNRVGRDTFRYTATDSAGNVSNEATVTVEIVKPSDKARYIDMNGDPDEYAATWMRECGLFEGETVAGNLCFSPDHNVTRGEFLAMTMQLIEAQPAAQTIRTGFADEADAPIWMQPYISAALQNGMIEGVASDNGIVFRPTAAITKAEAAVLLQNTLNLPVVNESEVFASGAVPTWAQTSVEALSGAGIAIAPTFSAEDLTRRDAAKLLRQVADYLEKNKDAPLPWINS